MTKENYKMLGIVVVGSAIGCLAALVFHQKVTAPMLAGKITTAPATKA